MNVDVGRFGVWLGQMQWRPEIAAAIETLGYGTLWIGGSPPADLTLAEQLLDATETVVVGTSIVNVWNSDAATVSGSFHRLEARHPGRFLLGVGIGHPEATADYASPFETLVRYLDGLDGGGVPSDRRVVAALGPRVLQLSADRSAGAIPYLVTAEHTRRARELLGPGVLLAPEHKVVVDADEERGRGLGRERVKNPYLGLRNYLQNLRTLGYSDEDLADSGSDRLIDDLVFHGEAADVAAGLKTHLDAGADHVAIQPLNTSSADIEPQLRALADVLSLSAE